jgi:predicted TPR repeat methyltransferase
VAFDLIVSADTLVYFGALEEVVLAAAAALRPMGTLIFTVEEAASTISADYCIESHGRYSHRCDYVQQVLANAGLRAHVVRAELRLEGGVPVSGLVIRAERIL